MTTHDDRIHTIKSTFLQANDQLIASLQQLDDSVATRAPAGAWTPAQIGCHVALTSDFLAAVLRGAVAEMSVARPDGFQEALATLQLPDRVKTFPALEPPETRPRWTPSQSCAGAPTCLRRPCRRPRATAARVCA